MGILLLALPIFFMTAINFSDLFHSFSAIKVAVIGDVMLDTYCWGKVERISPEAPVPVVAVISKEQRIGGAGNVALNLQALGAHVSLISVTGNDEEAIQLSVLLQKHHINDHYVVKSDDRITTNKTRVISRNQQMMRLDAEITTPLNEKDEQQLLQSFQNYIATEKPDIIILEDYNKGVLTANAINSIIALCKSHNILTSVDPKRKNFFAYKGVDIFKPNLQEAKEGLNIIAEEVSDALLDEIHDELKKQLQHKISFITLSEKGVYYQSESASEWIPTHIRQIADVSGAGDTVIAVASLVYAATRDVKLMADMANVAGGLVCEEVGTVAIDKEKFLNECNKLL